MSANESAETRLYPPPAEFAAKAAVSGVGLQLLAIQIVVIGATATEEQQRLSDRNSLLFLGSALVDKAAQRCQSGTRSDQDDRSLGIAGKSERTAGVLDNDAQRLTGLCLRKVVTTESFTHDSLWAHEIMNTDGNRA